MNISAKFRFWTTVKALYLDAKALGFHTDHFLNATPNSRLSVYEQCLKGGNKKLAEWFVSEGAFRKVARRKRIRAVEDDTARDEDNFESAIEETLTAILADGQLDGITGNMNDKARGSNDDGADLTDLAENLERPAKQGKKD